MLGIDSTHRIDPATLTAHGVGAVGRYVMPFAAHSWKATTLGETNELRRAGFATFFVRETTTSRPRAGYAAGLSDALDHNATLDALGVPRTVAAVWADDEDEHAWSDVAQYAAGWAHGCQAAGGRPPGVYGEAMLIEEGQRTGVIAARCGWQTNAHGWDSPRRTAAGASIRQGLPSTSPIPGTDPDDVDANSPLLWLATVAGHPSPPPVTTPPNGPFDMLTDQQQAKLIADVAASHLILEQLQAAMLGDRPKLGTVPERTIASLTRLEADTAAIRKATGAPPAKP